MSIIIKKIYSIIGLLFLINSYLFSNLYEVGDGQILATPNDVPWESLNPGDTVSIHYRAEPYKSKWVICRAGTKEAPIVIQGIADIDGNLPIIDGVNATTRAELNYWNEERSVIKIGGANKPENTMPQYIILKNLEIKGGRPPAKFTGDSGESAYDNNAAGIFIEKGEHIILHNCILHECGNGLFVADGSSDIVVEYCHLYDNGISGRYFEHNSYTSANGILFQFNKYSFLGDDCGGNNLKDRSAGLIVRYNWIEGGNRQLDLVESSRHLCDLETYPYAHVYGNILIEREGEGNRQIIHFGGDGGEEQYYRKTLYLWNNTIISTRTGRNTLMRLSSNDQTCYSTNNLIFVTAEAKQLEMLSQDGTLYQDHYYSKPGWINTHSGVDANVIATNGIETDSPYFTDFENNDFSLTPESPCIDIGANLIEPMFKPEYIYIKDRLKDTRFQDDKLDIGAFEYIKQSDIFDNKKSNITVYPNPLQNKATVVLGFDIENRDFEYKIISIDGKILISGIANSNIFTFSIANINLANNAYYLQINIDGELKTIPFLIER